MNKLSPSTQIDFYMLPEGIPLQIFTCRLTEKASRRGHQCYIYCEDGIATELDNLLWTYRPESFLAHNPKNQEGAQICVASIPPSTQQTDILINLTDQTPDFAKQFNRVLIIIPHENREACRDQYRHYKQQGNPIKVHNL